LWRVFKLLEVVLVGPVRATTNPLQARLASQHDIHKVDLLPDDASRSFVDQIIVAMELIMMMAAGYCFPLCKRFLGSPEMRVENFFI
jgi:hypothetical protein